MSLLPHELVDFSIFICFFLENIVLLHPNSQTDFDMNNCKHFDFDNAGNGICRLGGTCDMPEHCSLREEKEQN